MPGRKSDLIRFRHIHDAARKALLFTKNKSLDEITADEKLTLALQRLLEIIGEAASQVTPEIQSRFPSIPWREIIGTRNRLIHGYDEVKMEVLFQIVSEDLPLLVQELTRIIDEADKQQLTF